MIKISIISSVFFALSIFTSINAAKHNLASGVNDGLETKISAIATGDTIMLTDIGPYISTSPKIAMTKSITILAANGLASQPIVKVNATSNMTNFFWFSTTGTYTLTLEGVEFDGNGQTQVFVQSTVKTGITMKNCVVRNFVYPSPGIAGAVFGYSNLVGGYDQLYVEDSKFYNTGGVIRATSTAYPTNATFKNCYFDAITAFTDKSVIYSQAPAGNTITVNHCTFNGCNYPELQFASCTPTVQNCLFLNSTASAAPTLGTATFTDHCAIYCTSGNIDVVYPLAKRDATTLLTNPALNSYNYATALTHTTAASDGKTIGFTPKLKVTVTPQTASIQKDATQQFTTAITDSLSAYIPLSSTLSWSATSGSIDAAGLYTGSLSGNSFTVTASTHGCKGYASINVNGINVSISPITATAYLGYSLQFSSLATDQNGTPYNATKSWSATGAGTIDATGLFTPTSLGTAQITATIGGYSKTINIEVVPPTTTVQVSMGTHNFSWTFDKAYIEHGYFVDGQPWIVLPTGGANLIAASPARIVGASVKDGTGATISADINQTVVNPPVGTYFLNNTGNVLIRNAFGWDSRGVLRSTPLGYTYDATLAWDGNPLAMTAGDIVTTAQSLVSQTPSNTVLDAVAVLSVLATAPPADAFRPGSIRSAARKANPEIIRMSDIIDLNPYLIQQPVNTILNNPISTVDPVFSGATLTNLMPGPSILNAGMLQNRGYNALYNNSSKGYGADVAEKLGDVAVGALAAWLTPAERNICRVRLIQRAIDTYEALLAGVTLTYNGGHTPAYGALLTIAGKMLNNAGMIGINQSINGREPLYFLSDYGQAIYVDDSDTNYNDGITPSVGNIRRIKSDSSLPWLNRITLPLSAVADGSLTIARSFNWAPSRSSSEVQNIKLKVESGPGAGPDYYVVTDMVDFYNASVDTLTNDTQLEHVSGGTLIVKPAWKNGIPTAASVIKTYLALPSELPMWAFKQGGVTVGNYTYDYTFSPTTPYGTINVGAYLSMFIAMYALDAENVYSSGLDRWLVKSMSVHGYGEAMFSDSNSRRPNGTTNYNGSLFLSGLWKEQVLDKKGISYVHGPFYSTSYAACSELLVPDGNISTVEKLIANENIKVYFNDASSIITIQSDNKIESFKVFSMQGIELFSAMPNCNQYSLDIAKNHPTSGLIVRVVSGGKMIAKKLFPN